MRHTFLLAFAIVTAMASAQSLNVNCGNVTYTYPASQGGRYTCVDAEKLDIGRRSFSIAEISSITVEDREVSDNTVEVAYSGGEAFVTVAGNIAPYVEASVSAANVTIVQSSEVSEATCGEITYVLSGESDNGSLLLSGEYKSTVELRGLTLNNPSGAAIDIQNGKRIELSAKNGTVNSLSDGAGGKQKGALVCKGHLELKGKGVLNVVGNSSHAIYSKEYVEMKNATVNITGAVKDGINCAQYFFMESGSLSIAGVGDDGIQVSFKDDTDREEEDTGCAEIAGGSINIEVTASASKGIKADGDISITDGVIEILVSGNGKWDSDDNKTKAAACLSADGNITVSGGSLNLSATGSGGKGMSCDGDLVYDGGETTISTTGGLFAYVNGTTYDNYTGNTDRLDSDYKSSPKGIKADGAIVINSGTISVKTSGNGGEGIESKSTLTINGGIINIKAQDDAINSSGHMYIKGGDITVVSTSNDGLDSNGNLYIEGGIVRTFGSGSPECGIDANTEEGYSVFFTGGTILAVGGSNSVPSSAESTQPYVSASGSLTAGQTVALYDGSTLLAEFIVPDTYAGSGNNGGFGGRPGGGSSGGAILVSCSDLVSGHSYTLKYGSSSTTVSAVLRGSGGNFPR